MFGKSKPSETVNVVFCFVIKPATVMHLQALDQAPASVRLLAQYFQDAPQGASCANSVKLIGRVSNWDQASLPSMLKSFNGKPTLVTKSGLWYSTWSGDGTGYAELDVDTSQWCYMARCVDALDVWYDSFVWCFLQERAALVMEKHWTCYF